MGVMLDIVFWFTVFLGTGALLFCSVYTLLLYSDLSVDHINPIDLCEYVNRTVLPEYIGHFVLAILLLLRGYLLAVALNLPLIAYHLRNYLDRTHLLQNTSIFNEVDKHRARTQIKLAYHLLMFFVYLYFFISSLLIN